MDRWREKSRHRMPLYAFMWQTQYGMRDVPCVYLIAQTQAPVYVGQTRAGLRNRLWKHVYSGSRLGFWIVEHERDEDTPACDCIVIDGNLDAAELYYIHAEQPALNQVLYKQEMAVPPLARASIKMMLCANVRVGMFDRAMTFDAASYHRHMVTVQAQEQNDTNASLDRLYAKAYRDPAHPLLRDENADTF